MEKDLVGLAGRVDPLRLADACARLRLAAAPDHAAADEWAAFQQRRLSVSRTFAGLAAVDGVLDPLSAETVMTAVHAFSAPAGGQDPRTPGQRRADALTEICRRVLGFADTPTVAGERPHLTVTVPLQTLTGITGSGSTNGDAATSGGPVDGDGTTADRAAGHADRGRGLVDGDGSVDCGSGPVHGSVDGGAHGPSNDGNARGGSPRLFDDNGGLVKRSEHAVGELAWAGPISPELARLIACDATITRVVLGPASQPLNVGRATRVVPAGLRKTLLVRDKTCRYPGCDTPGARRDAHHQRH